MAQTIVGYIQKNKIFVGYIQKGFSNVPGATGATGPTGATGAQGPAATISVGTVTTGAAGSSAVVTNVGTSGAAIFDFTIPRGDAGGYNTIQEEGVDVTQRSKLNFIGAAVTATDDAINNRTDITITAVGSGDVSSNTSSSVVNEIALFADTSGKLIKRATTTGLAKLASGVLSVATAGTDYYNPGGTDVAVADGGTNLSSYTTGDILYASGATTLAKLAIGASDSYYLGVTSGLPAWKLGYGSVSLVWNETPSGTVNGTNALFTTSQAYVSGSLRVYRDGVLMKSGSGNDYTETTPASGTFTFETAQIPVTGTNILVEYQTSASATGNADTVDSYHANAALTASNLLPLDSSSKFPVLSNYSEGTLINGKISVIVASNAITLALKTLSGGNPSSSDPVFITIGGVIRKITAALSVTKSAGTNWFGSGSTGLATQEIDYFAYMGYNATDGMTIGHARFPSATQYSDFSTTSTNEKYCAISTITNASSNDPYVVIGRFAATLSATASFNWSVPTYTPSNLIQRPIYTTRALTYVPTSTGFSGSPTNSCSYWITGNEIKAIFSTSATTSNATTFTLTVPFSAVGQGTFVVRVLDNGTWAAGLCAWTTNLTLYKDVAANAFTSSGSKGLDSANMYVRIS